MVYSYPAYNLSGMANSSGIVDLMQTVNSELMFGLMGVMILLTLFFITFMAFYSSSGEAGKSLAASSVICFGLSMLLIILDMISEFVVYLLLIASAFFVAMLMFNKK